ncbi:hypothetical protein NL676_038424 [Syzygium grande]|nr:hypothetical protein NL676_038424 [Syzygium grande]
MTSWAVTLAHLTSWSYRPLRPRRAIVAIAARPVTLNFRSVSQAVFAAHGCHLALPLPLACVPFCHAHPTARLPKLPLTEAVSNRFVISERRPCFLTPTA